MVAVSVLPLGLVVAVDISVIIPSNHGHHELLKIVRAVCGQTVKPAELVIVDSSGERDAYPEQIAELCAASGIRLIYERRASSLPGDARNIGLGCANAELIAFIDVQTIPRPQWLQASLNLFDSHDIDGVLGATCFSADTTFETVVRDSFYGVMPRKTLPGSIFRREVFHRVGQFIDWVRAGEDTEWLLRLELLKIPVVCPPNALIDYVGLIGLDTKKMLKKWYRNYAAARDLPHFFPQKLLLWLVFYPLLILLAYKWNYLIAEWRMDSPLYIGHVTKIVAILPGLTYVLVRGLMLPLHRGVGIWRLFPIRLFAIALVCVMADAIKVLVFSFPKRNIDVNSSIFYS
jgi:glycosyltransferase involved in cell wall biosynthesis